MLEEESVSDAIQEMVVKISGNIPMIHTATCVTWKASHSNCIGCESELACSQVVTIMMLTLESSTYEPVGYDDFEYMKHRIAEKMISVLEARTTDEVRKIVR